MHIFSFYFKNNALLYDYYNFQEDKKPGENKLEEILLPIKKIINNNSDSEDSIVLSDDLRKRKHSMKTNFVNYLEKDHNRGTDTDNITFKPLYAELLVPESKRALINDFSTDGKIIIKRIDDFIEKAPKIEVSNIFKKYREKVASTLLEKSQTQIIEKSPDSIIENDTPVFIMESSEEVEEVESSSTESTVSSRGRYVDFRGTITRSEIPKIVSPTITQTEIKYSFSKPIELPEIIVSETGDTYFYIFNPPILNVDLPSPSESEIINIKYNFSRPIIL